MKIKILNFIILMLEKISNFKKANKVNNTDNAFQKTKQENTDKGNDIYPLW